ncbi:WXG100 family type VII secretion target [Cellulomonas shaoxiangyii]|uniref:WXG100 family type VII secretion target n=1 Tax=Cellulomonas shaoxiangyii TaxID=2566013 RepID=A0A4V1CN19_9CELL|nr:WXG100 family type VII secretion target [Cellulomonas shaoxiangyii]QCB94905.1 WXG100 family type VII secretion target [Cellulomonas shaoxiangyii]TGY79082.1 WXG100 family type VII secretion target [Cellulomonas shaoxiangyii]
MSVRNLGDWSPLGRGSDPVEADPEKVQEAGRRYRDIATTITDAVGRLERIVSTGSEGLAGKYAEKLREDATSVRDGLAKASVRYEDVAREIARYQPELDDALTETAGALTDAREATSAGAAAEGLPDGVPGEDGALPADERAKDEQKATAVAAAADRLTAATRRMDTAVEKLGVAGKRFGDAVNCKRYDDGLSHTLKDEIIAALKIVSKALAIIAMVLGVLCILIPGVAALVALAAVAAVAGLAVTATLYATGNEGLTDLIFAVLGVALLGGLTVASLVGKHLSVAARGLTAGIKRQTTTSFLPLQNLGTRFPRNLPSSVPAGWKNQSDWFNNPLTNRLLPPGLVPEVGFWASSKQQLLAAGGLWRSILTNPRQAGGNWLGVVGGWSGYTGLAAIQGGAARSTSSLWGWWGAGNSLFAIGAGLAWTGGRTTEVIGEYGAREGAS